MWTSFAAAATAEPVLLLLLHAFATLFMTGVIWIVQLCQYPLFAEVGTREFPAFHREHMRRIGWIVGPAMLLEFGCALWIAVAVPASVQTAPARVALVLLLAVWATTALVQVPQHRKLEQGKNPALLRSLVRWNWIRTGLWSARSVLALAWLAGR